MDSDKQPTELCYVVYMPVNERATCQPIHVPKGAQVKNLVKAIREDDEFKVDIGSEKVYIYKCGVLLMEPESDDPGQQRYNQALEWLSTVPKPSPMNPVHLLERYLPTEGEKIDVIVATDSMLKSIVEARTVTTTRPPSPGLSAHICRREATVSGLWQRLMNMRFIWARGTPGSGKSILCRLLYSHAEGVDPSAKVIWIDMWPATEQNLLDGSFRWRRYLSGIGWDQSGKTRTIIIIDEAQLTYDDHSLWSSFFKSVETFPNVFVICFASYGSASTKVEVRGTPFFIAPKKRVTLRPVVLDDVTPAVGILLTKQEFDDVVRRRYRDLRGHRFDMTFLDGVFVITSGHIGAIDCILRIAEASNVYVTAKRTESGTFTWDTFAKAITLETLVAGLLDPGSAFRRGLPEDEDLRKEGVFKALKTVIEDGVVMARDADALKTSLEYCAKQGWLHSDSVDDDNSELIGYCFASYLHQWYVAWKLHMTVPPASPNVDLLEFVLHVIRLFNPRQFSSERRMGPAFIQRPPEAQYQDEFYRCSNIVSSGALLSFPEFGLANGRVDFYVPSKKWGIELLRNGDRLAQHSGRFSTSGAYGGTLALDDYIILDFRTTTPRSNHPGIPKLYHVVFQEDYTKVYVLDNMRKRLSEEGFMLIRPT